MASLEQNKALMRNYIEEAWANRDDLGFLQQIGLIPQLG